ncbi:MAG: hypothetical protein KAY32_15115, partial [Candidatus Eisenbacteria sp.]|nr:hypothetical protein [Candidatus Eisenbacteria bacterium]
MSRKIVFIVASLALPLLLGCGSEESAKMQVLGTGSTTAELEDPVGACCLRGGGCTVVTEKVCEELSGGHWEEGADCDPNPCSQPALQTGACCLTDGSCLIGTADE